MDPQTTEGKTGVSRAREDMSAEERAVHINFMREAIAMVTLLPLLNVPQNILSLTHTLQQGELALQTDETPVGCVFVHEGVIIGRGTNATNRTLNGTRHAEFEAINEILTTPASTSSEDLTNAESPEGVSDRCEMKYTPAILKECDLYVTVEPCIMCASLLRQFGIRKVYFGASNEKFGGTGGVLNIHRANGRVPKEGEVLERHKDDYEVSGGWLREEAILLLRRFYVQENGKGWYSVSPFESRCLCLIVYLCMLVETGADVQIAPVPKKRKDRTVKEVEPLEEATQS
ncbi:hypothetical protein BP5796_09525 [Coleophoma crateriformis]|uniref:CMP/dCMP-type deaminase domain-containing protein n=1 Tax=Coleophoma crateriformis TaxID=565419 RepID=A0A3D8QYA3_9HELO|nr:hypothetical protein BP5796_09525 [Coleophoma crateriformis]